MTCQDCGREHMRDSRWCVPCMAARIAAVPDPRAGHGDTIEVMYRHGAPTNGREDILVSHTCPGCGKVAPTCLPGIDPASLCAACGQTAKISKSRSATPQPKPAGPRKDW